MGHMLHNFTDGLGHARKPGALHGADGGEMPVMLDEMLVTVRYELTMLGRDELAEVNEVEIGGHTIPAGYFAADTLQAWGSEILRSRDATAWMRGERP